MQLRLIEKVMQFGFSGADCLLISSIHHVYDGVDASTVSLPHCAESRLTADIPQLDGHVALGDLAHVEANSGYHVLGELTRGYDIDKRGLSGELQADERQLHFLLPKETLEPVQNLLNKREHVRIGILRPASIR